LCVVPVNIKLHPDEIAYMVNNSGSRTCMTQASLFEPMKEALSGTSDVQVVDVGSSQFCSAFDSPELPLGPDEDQSLAWLFYTSGTTGKPKGVMLSHANLVSMAQHFYSDVQGLDPKDILVHVAPMSHGSGIYSIPYFIKGGVQLVPESGGFDEAELFDLFTQYQRISLFAAPTIVQRLVRFVQASKLDAPGLRSIFVGGAPFYVEDIKLAVACFGPRIIHMYGQGESPMTISGLPPENLARAVEIGDLNVLSSVGFPQTAMQVEILDDDNQSVPAGVLGEVVVRGPAVMMGYWNNPEATTKTLHNGALRTGDIGMLDARGLLHLKDRSKDVIISGGTNIYPREVEDVLLTHPMVSEVSVVGAPDPEWGESVVAFIVFCRDQAVQASELDTHCLQRIARFKRPKFYVFVDDLPKNGAGKVMKRELQQILVNMNDQCKQTI
jgi:long-chain acyl-CoA synthetase